MSIQFGDNIEVFTILVLNEGEIRADEQKFK